MPSKAVSQPSSRILISTLRLANVATRGMSSFFLRYDVTPQQWALLSVLAESEESPTLAGLAREMLVSKQNVTGMIARLEQLGLVERSGDPADLRASRIDLTRRGASVVQRIAPAFEKWAVAALGPIPEREQKALARSMQRVVETMQQRDRE
jgi:DNA-binding MarR family transcriptional regulator